MREEYATSYAKLRLPLPLPPDGDADTDLSTGAQAGLPIYSSPPAGSQEEQLEASLKLQGGGKCPLCVEPFHDGATLMLCYHCGAAVHVRCLARKMLTREAGNGCDEPCEVIPFEGTCWEPACARRLLWSRLVKRVQVYRRSGGAQSESSGPERGFLDDDDGVGEEEEEIVGGDPPVWRVDDSSSDDDDDNGVEEEEGGNDRSSDYGSDGAGEGWSSGAASRDLVSQTDPEEGEDKEEDYDDDDDDDFWRLSNGTNRHSEARQTGGHLGASGQNARLPPRAERSGNAGCIHSRSSPALAGAPAACVSLVDAGEAHDGDCSKGGEQDGEEMNSRANLPLAARLRLRRLKEN